MKRFLNSVAQWLSPNSKTPSLARTSRLGLEQLEERSCPTTVTVAAFANALDTQIINDVNRLVHDAASVVQSAVSPLPRAKPRLCGP